MGCAWADAEKSWGWRGTGEGAQLERVWSLLVGRCPRQGGTSFSTSFPCLFCDGTACSALDAKTRAASWGILFPTWGLANPARVTRRLKASLNPRNQSGSARGNGFWLVLWQRRWGKCISPMRRGNFSIVVHASPACLRGVALQRLAFPYLGMRAIAPRRDPALTSANRLPSAPSDLALSLCLLARVPAGGRTIPTTHIALGSVVRHTA